MSRPAMKIPIIDTVILFGGGLLIIEFAKEALKRGVAPYVFAVTRHLEEVIDGETNLTLQQALRDANVPFYHTADINSSKDLKSILSQGGNALGIGLGEAYTFDKETIKLFDGRLFDFMVIRLPQYRGGAHFTWQILRKDRIGCWNIQVINEEMVPGGYDSGEIIKTREYAIPQWARIPQDFFQVAHEEGLKLFIDFMDEIRAGKEFPLARLQENFSLYLPRLYTLKHAYINWSWSTDEIETFIRAFDEPYPGASTFLAGKRFFLKDCQAVYTEGKFHPFMSGLIYRISENSVFVASRDGALMVGKVCDGKGNDAAPSLKVGHRFCTPMKYLEEAMLFSAEYNTEGLVREE